MAESIYKGLTIRIGADVSDLRRALKSSDGAIKATQKELRKLENAAKLDPANVGVLAAKMGLLGDKATALFNTYNRLRSNPAMKIMANDTENVALKARRARDEYNSVNEQIAAMKRRFALLNNEDPDKAFKKIEEGSAAAKAKLRELGATEAEVARYTELVTRHFQALGRLNHLNKLAKEAHELKIELAANDAEIRQICQEMARLKAQNPAITLTEEFARFRREMDRADEASKALRSEMGLIDDALKLDPNNLNAAYLKMRNLQEQTRLNITSLKSMSDQLDAMRAKGIDKVSSSITNLNDDLLKAEQHLAETEAEFRKLKARLVEMENDTSLKKKGKELEKLQAETKEWEAKLRQAEQAVDELGAVKEFRKLESQIERTAAAVQDLIGKMRGVNGASSGIGGAVQQLGWSAYSTVTPLASMFAYSAIRSAEEVDAAYRNMRKTVQGTDEQFEELRQSALDFSRTHVTSADQLLEIQAMGGQLGLGVESLDEFAEAVSNIQIATGIDVETLAVQLGQLQGILNDMGEGDFAKFGDALVRLGNNNAALEEKIMNVMLRIASLGTITGFSTTELLAWSTAVAATGQGAEAAGTAISKTFSDIEAAVGEGGKTLEAFADVAGMSSTEFANAWNTDPSSAMFKFIDGLRLIGESGGSADRVLEELGITSVRQKQAILGLTQTVGDLGKNLEMAERAWNGEDDEFGAAGDAAREAQRKAEGFSGAIQILRNNVQALGVEMGDSFAPVIKALSELVAKFTEFYSDLPETEKSLVNFGIAAAAAFGPVLVFANGFGRAFRDIKKSLFDSGDAMMAAAKGSKAQTAELTAQAVATGHVTESTKNLTKAQKAQRIGMGALKGAFTSLGIGVAVTGAMYLIDAFIEMHKEAENMKKATDGLNNTMSEAFRITEANAEATEDYTANLGDAAGMIEKARDAQAELADTITGRYADLQTSTAMLREYGESIEELSGKELNDEEVAELENAVKELNETCGTSYEVVKDAAGQYVVMGDGAIVATEAIWSLIEAQEAQMRHEVHKENWEDTYAERTKAAQAYTEALEEQQAAQDHAEEMMASGEWSKIQAESYMAPFNAKLKEADDLLGSIDDKLEFESDAMNMATAATKEDTDAITKWVDANMEFKSMCESNRKDLSELKNDLIEAGASTELLAGMTDAELLKMVQSYNGSSESIIAAMAGMSGKTYEHGQNAISNWYLGMSKDTKNAIDLARDVTGMSLQEFYTAAAEMGISGEEGVAAYAAAMIAKKPQAKNAAQIVAGAAKSGLTVDAKASGENFTLGFAVGIISELALGHVRSNARTVASAAIAAMKARGEEGSPWRTTMRSGAFFTQGFAEGILSEARRAEQAASVLVKDTMDAAQKAMGPDGLSMHMGIATGFAAATNAAASSVVNNSPVVYNVSIDGATINADEEIKTVTLNTVRTLVRKGSA